MAIYGLKLNSSFSRSDINNKIITVLNIIEFCWIYNYLLENRILWSVKNSKAFS